MKKQEELEWFEKTVKDLSKEFAESVGSLTCEHSTSGEYLPEKLKILIDNNTNLDNRAGYWIIFPCDTCKGYDEDKPYHVMIIETRSQSDYIAEHKQRESEKKIAELETKLDGATPVPNDVLKVVVDTAVDSCHASPTLKMPSEVLYATTLVDDLTEDETQEAS